MSQRNLQPFPTAKKKKRERSKQTNLDFPPSIPKYNEIRRAVWEGGSLKGGRGSLIAGETDGARFSVSSPRRVSRSSPPGAGSGSWGRTARGDDPPASGTGTAGVGTELRAARGQVANWIRERGGENHGRGGEPGRGAGVARAAERGSCSHLRPPSFPSPRREKRLSGQARRLPRRRYLFPEAPALSLPDPKKTQALGAAPRSDAGRSRGPAPERGPGPRSRAGGRAGERSG